MFFLVGIDDTDTATHEDTGPLAIRLGSLLQERRYASMLAVTRHRLLQHPDLPRTTSNNAVCILLDADSDRRRDIELTCREFLLRQSAPSSEPGFAFAAWNTITYAIVEYGQLARLTILKRMSAVELAKTHGIAIAGFHGRGSGVIGALAAIGLHYSGEHGRYIWLPGLARLSGVLTAPEILRICDIDRLENFRGRRPLERDRVFLGDQPTPILREGKSLLLLEAASRGDPFEWRVYTREELDRLSA